MKCSGRNTNSTEKTAGMCVQLLISRWYKAMITASIMQQYYSNTDVIDKVQALEER